jgi:3-hydroxymyristoyl/3-hydroxydecanoyl-(acyl carrier protein) dehydratase
VFTDVSVDGDTARAVVDPAHASALCAGHFPGDPLVPGAYLAELMAALAGRLAGDRPPVEVVRCVFLSRVRPSEPITLDARRVAGTVDVVLRAGATTCAEATLRFA